MEIVGDLVARDQRSADPALRHTATGREYDYRRFCTTAWKVGNFLRNEGVRTGARVTVADDPTPEAVLSFYGAALLGAAVSFGGTAADAKAVVAPVHRLGEFDVSPSTRRVTYGDAHDDPSVAHFERDVWSENPTRPPDRFPPSTALLTEGEYTVTHAEALASAARVVEKYALDSGTIVSIRAPFSHAGTVIAGLIAPVLTGGTVLLPSEGQPVGDVAVAAGDAPESEIIRSDTVP